MITGSESLCVCGTGSRHMKTLHRNHDPPSDNAERQVPAYHAAALLPTANTIAHKYITNVYSIKSIAVVLPMAIFSARQPN